MVKYSLESGDVKELCEPAELFSEMQSCHISGVECFVGHCARKSKLFINDKLFSNQCTSFHVSQTFLSFTNSTEGLSHELFNYDLNKKLPKPVSGSEVPAHPTLESSGNFNIRAVERGSKIVTVDPGTRTVLQMPRGNLEGIYPRLIVI